MSLGREEILTSDTAELDGLLASVRALELQLNAVMAQARAVRLMVEDRLEAPAGCAHPAMHRTYQDGAMGSRRTFDCGLCHERVEE